MRKITRIFLLYFALLFPMLNMGQVLATGSSEVDSSELRKLSSGDMTFYNPVAGCNGDSGEHCEAVDSSQITWIGDSYSAIGSVSVKGKFPNADFGPEPYNSASSFVMSCKFINSDQGCGDYNPSGLRILEDLVNGRYEGHTLRPYLVFALGTNTTDTSKSKMRENIDRVMELVGNDTKVIFVTAFTASWHGDGNPGNAFYKDANDALKEAASSNQNIYLADWAAVADDSYYLDDSSGIHPNNHYNEWVQVIESALPQNCTAGLLPGDTVEERIWNYFVNANVPGVSDNPAVIAGILGNFYSESGYNPFMLGAGGGYHGIYMVSDEYGGWDLYNEVNEVVGKPEYWRFYGWWSSPETVDSDLAEVGATQNEIDAAIRVELEYLMRSTTWAWFVEGLGNVEHDSGLEGAASYAELFLGIVENAFDGNGVFHDQKVAEYVRSKWGYHATYQGVDKRRENAQDAFSRLSTLTTPVGDNSNASSTSGYTKYELTDSQLWDLAEVAMRENNVNMTAFKNELSIMANIFEEPARGHTINGANLVDFIAHGGWFSTSGLVNGQQDFPVDSGRLSAARDILINGNRTLPVEIVEHDYIGDILYGSNNGTQVPSTEWQSGVTQIHTVYQDEGEYWIFYGWIGGQDGLGDPMGYKAGRPPTETQTQSNSDNNSTTCPEDEPSGPGGLDIAKAAVEMAWPVQIGQGDDAHAGMCATDANYTHWVPYSSNAADCYENPRQLYRQRKDSLNIGVGGMYDSCDYFVATIIYYLGMDDGGFPTAFPANEGPWMASHPDKWENIPNTPDAKLEPGDIFVNDSHIMIWVGEYGGSYGPWADASWGTRVGMVNNFYGADETGYQLSGEYFNIYRRKGSKIGSGGLDEEQAMELAMNYGDNINDVPRINTGGLWNACADEITGANWGGSNCVSFSAFFVSAFTDYEYPGGNGWEVARNLASANGLTNSSTPEAFSVFSWGNGDGWGHTGVLVGIHDDEYIFVEASCTRGHNGKRGKGDGTYEGSGSAYVVVTSDYTRGYSSMNFTHLDNVNTQKLESFIKGTLSP